MIIDSVVKLPVMRIASVMSVARFQALNDVIIDFAIDVVNAKVNLFTDFND